MGQLSEDAKTDALHFALRVADAADSIILFHAGNVRSEMKPDGTPVSDVDRAIERMVHAAVKRDRRGEEVLGEENVTGYRPDGSRIWVVDPIDGTELLVNGDPGYVFSMALVIDGQPEVAVVRDPRTGRSWYATLGGGAWLNGTTRLRVSDHTQIIRQAGWEPARPAGNMFLWPDVVSLVDGAGVTPLEYGSVIRSAMDVAMGRLDGLMFGRSGPWDMATAALIVPEAGGRFTDLLGFNQRVDQPVNGGLLSNLWIHEDLVQLVEHQR